MRWPTRVRLCSTWHSPGFPGLRTTRGSPPGSPSRSRWRGAGGARAAGRGMALGRGDRGGRQPGLQAAHAKAATRSHAVVHHRTDSASECPRPARFPRATPQLPSPSRRAQPGARLGRTSAVCAGGAGGLLPCPHRRALSARRRRGRTCRDRSRRADECLHRSGGHSMPSSGQLPWARLDLINAFVAYAPRMRPGAQMSASSSLGLR